MSDARRELDAVRRIARRAAKLVLGRWRGSLSVDRKGRIDLVTEVDLASEDLIREELAAAFPGVPIVGEERSEAAPLPETAFIVDPIDGTTNFAHGHPFFAVSIGLRREGALVLGVVAAPALGRVWDAAEGLGAFRDGAPMRVSARPSLEGALAATGFPYDRRERDDDNLAEHAAFVMATRGVRRCGSAACDLALVAEGTYDLYWEQGLKPWDLAGGVVLVREAGGRVTDYRGGAFALEDARLVASNGVVHDDALALLARAGRGRRT